MEQVRHLHVELGSDDEQFVGVEREVPAQALGDRALGEVDDLADPLLGDAMPTHEGSDVGSDDLSCDVLGRCGHDLRINLWTKVWQLPVWGLTLFGSANTTAYVAVDSSLYRMADRMVGGDLGAILTGLKANGASSTTIAKRLYADHGIDVSSQTVANWLAALTPAEDGAA